ncbi:MAG: adenylosuccinate synthase [Bryobacteraceae bacterium]
MSNLIVLGAQWGDEGKGKVVDLFSDRFDIVARYQGGHNAGHTVYIGEKKFILKHIPTGILRPGKLAVIGNGMVIEPIALMEELDGLAAAGVDVTARLAISNRAHLILPYHRIVERISEAREGRTAIGTTLRGIGPAYEDKIGRRGIRMADFIDPETLSAFYHASAADKLAVARAFDIQDEIDVEGTLARLQAIADRVRPMVRDTAQLLNEAVRMGKRVLLEGAQGTMLDIDHGTYPFVTSSSASSGGAATGTGLPPNRIHGIVGVGKAYITRVGGGPFATEILDERGDQVRNAGKEFGSVTGRPRRCGWFDVPLMRYTAMINGFDSLVITKLDVLDQFDAIPMCVAYRCGGRELTAMPADLRTLDRIEPVMETLPGWQTNTHGMTAFEDLPSAAREYLRFLEDRCGVEIGCVSTGPERNQTILRSGSKLEGMISGHSVAGGGNSV